MRCRGSARADGSWMELTIGGQPFRFLLGAPVFLLNDRLETSRRPGLTRRTTPSFMPFQFVAEVLPQVFAGFYRYDAAEGRLLEATARPKPPAARLPNGLLPGHVVTVDAGHGGVDPGNPGVFFPAGSPRRPSPCRWDSCCATS